MNTNANNLPNYRLPYEVPDDLTVLSDAALAEFSRAVRSERKEFAASATRPVREYLEAEADRLHAEEVRRDRAEVLS